MGRDCVLAFHKEFGGENRFVLVLEGSGAIKVGFGLRKRVEPGFLADDAGVDGGAKEPVPINPLTEGAAIGADQQRDAVDYRSILVVDARCKGGGYPLREIETKWDGPDESFAMGAGRASGEALRCLRLAREVLFTAGGVVGVGNGSRGQLTKHGAVDLVVVFNHSSPGGDAHLLSAGSEPASIGVGGGHAEEG